MLSTWDAKVNYELEVLLTLHSEIAGFKQDKITQNGWDIVNYTSIGFWHVMVQQAWGQSEMSTLSKAVLKKSCSECFKQNAI